MKLNKLAFLCIVLATFFAFAQAREVRILVPGMHCPLCTSMIKKALLGVEGVQSAKVKLNTKTADVVVADTVSDETLLKAVASTGYTGEIAK